ncbi:AAA family ATPase [Nostoc sp. NIES-2111]
MSRFHFLPPQPGDDDPPERCGVTNLGSVTASSVSWLWLNRLAIGSITLVAGDPGLGKSQLAAALCAPVTAGLGWPDGAPAATRGSVLVIATEDGLHETIRPRYEAAGNQIHSVYVVCESVAPDAFLEQLERMVDTIGTVRLVVIDPVSAALDLRVHAARGSLTELSRLAQRYRFAVLGITHLAKGAGHRALARMLGPTALGAVARAAFLVASDPDHAGRLLLLEVKNNLGRAPTLAFQIAGVTLDSGIATSRVEWVQASTELTADAVMAAHGRNAGQQSEVDRAMDFLRDELSGAPVPAKVLRTSALNFGISAMTFRRAAERLRVERVKSGFEGGWEWQLPGSAKVIKGSEGAHASEVIAFKPDEHLP